MFSTKAEDNFGLVHYVIRKYFRKHPADQDYEDYFQSGCEGLVKAMQRYDASYDTEFSTFAVPLIKGEIYRYLRDCSYILKIPREQQIKLAKYKMLKSKGYTNDEIRKIFDVDIETYKGISEAYTAISTMISLDSTIPTDEKQAPLHEYIPDSKDVEEQALESLMKEQVLSLISKVLVQRDYYIYNLINSGKTQREVAKIVGMSQVNVSRRMNFIQTKVAEAIQAYLNGSKDEFEKLLQKKKEKKIV